MIAFEKRLHTGAIPRGLAVYVISVSSVAMRDSTVSYCLQGPAGCHLSIELTSVAQSVTCSMQLHKRTYNIPRCGGSNQPWMSVISKCCIHSGYFPSHLWGSFWPMPFSSTFSLNTFRSDLTLHLPHNVSFSFCDTGLRFTTKTVYWRRYMSDISCVGDTI